MIYRILREGDFIFWDEFFNYVCNWGYVLNLFNFKDDFNFSGKLWFLMYVVIVYNLVCVVYLNMFESGFVVVEFIRLGRVLCFNYNKFWCVCVINLLMCWIEFV